MKQLNFEYLVDNLESVPEVAGWIYDAWSYLAPEKTYHDLCEELTRRANKASQPLHIVAKLDAKVVGSATLKIKEMSEFPEWEDWLGSVVVSPDFQGSGIASNLSLKIGEIAKDRGITRLYLQTVALDGGLYKKLGWEPLKQVESKGQPVLVMVKYL